MLMKRSSKSPEEVHHVPLLRIDPLITDVDDKEATVECVLCDAHKTVDGDVIKLFWYEYHPSIHGQNTSRICDHCLFPPPKNIDFVMCSREKHLYCLYCIELKLFRIQLGRFVMEPDDTSDLGMQWERDYVDYRRNETQRGRSQSIISRNGLCSCFAKQEDYWTEEEPDQRGGTTRMRGYKAAANTSIIEMPKTEAKKKKKKRKVSGDKKSDENDSDSDNKMSKFNVVDEAEIDDLYNEDFAVNDDSNVVLESNKKKLKAVEILIEACRKGGRDPPSVVIELNYDKYSVYCFTYIMGKLELKQRPFLFHTLEFVAMVGPTTVLIQLIMQYKKQILMLPYKRIDSVLLSVIRGSKYSIATALKMAALAKEFSEIDLSAKEVFIKIKEKYAGIAVELLKQIESNHLAAVLLETPSDIEGKTPLELAFESELFSFLSQSKIEKIAHQVWIEQFFLNPLRTFEVSDLDSWNILEFLKNPYSFYFQPYGKYIIQTFLFFSYLIVFSYILIQSPAMYDVPEAIEIIFWVFNIGYLGYECYQAFVEDGLKEYLSNWTNYMDMSISINFALQIVLRLVWIFGGFQHLKCSNSKRDGVTWNYNTGLPLGTWQQCPTTAQIATYTGTGYWPSGCNETFTDWTLPNADLTYLCDFEPERAFYYSDSFKCDCWKQLDHYLSDSCCRKSDSAVAIVFNFLYGVNAILLWMRCLYFAEQNKTLGPLIKIIMAMKDDFVNYLKITLLFMVGFSFAIRAFIGDYSFEFDATSSTLEYMFKSTFGKIDFSVLEACGDSSSDLCSDMGWIPVWRSNLVQSLIMGYIIIALLMIRLLIAMISFTYNKKIRQAEHQVVYQYIKSAYELDGSSGLMPPPLNIFVFAITVVWLIMDTLMVILINRYIDVENHLQLAKPVGSSYIKRVWHGIQDLFSRNTTYWICAHCKAHNFEKYDVRHYLSQFRPACDPQDARIVEVYAPEICRKCYRNKHAVARMTIVLQQISFLVFVVVVYPCLCVVVFIPAIISWFTDYLTEDSADEGQWGSFSDDVEQKETLKRHQTMGGQNTTKRKDRRSPEYKLKKLRDKERKKKQEMIQQAERYRMLRQMQQLDTQLNAIPGSESHATWTALRKALKQIIRGFNPRHTKHILTPNINQIVDEVTSDKTPIAKLQNQVNILQESIDQIFDFMKASHQLTAATTIAQMQSFPNPTDTRNRDRDDDVDEKGVPSTTISTKSSHNDQFMQSVSKAAQQIQSALRPRMSNRPSRRSLKSNAQQTHTVHSHHEQGFSVQDIATTLLTVMGDGDTINEGATVEHNVNSLILKPTDVMRHKSSYKMKLIIDEEESQPDANEARISSTINIKPKGNNQVDEEEVTFSDTTEKYLEIVLTDVDNNDKSS